MKKQNEIGWQTVLPAAIAAIFLFGAFNLSRAQPGKPYGARDPRTCADQKSPARGAISAAQAKQYFICREERVEGEYLYLLENINVEVGAGRPYNPNSDINMSDVDTKSPVYPIRGSFDEYQCVQPNKIMDNFRRNCDLYPTKKAKGLCYRTGFGDWDCSMVYEIKPEQITEMKPPGDLLANAADKSKSTAAGGDETETTTAGEIIKAAKDDSNETQDDNGYPKPDFSELEKYFKIEKYAYAVDNYGNQTMNLTVTMLKPTNTASWFMTFYDEDGIKVGNPELFRFDKGDREKAGDRAKFYFFLPTEDKMKRVKKIVVAKNIE